MCKFCTAKLVKIKNSNRFHPLPLSPHSFLSCYVPFPPLKPLETIYFFLTMWEKYQPSGTTLASADFPASSSAFHSPSAYHFPISAYPAYHYSTIITTPSYYCIFWYILQKRGKKDDKFPRLSVFQLLPNISAVNSSFSSMMQCLLVVGSHFILDPP